MDGNIKELYEAVRPSFDFKVKIWDASLLGKSLLVNVNGEPSMIMVFPTYNDNKKNKDNKENKILSIDGDEIKAGYRYFLYVWKDFLKSIDGDIREETKEYVEKQLKILSKPLTKFEKGYDSFFSGLLEAKKVKYIKSPTLDEILGNISIYNYDQINDETKIGLILFSSFFSPFTDKNNDPIPLIKNLIRGSQIISEAYTILPENIIILTNGKKPYWFNTINVGNKYYDLNPLDLFRNHEKDLSNEELYEAIVGIHINGGIKIMSKQIHSMLTYLDMMRRIPVEYLKEDYEIDIQNNINDISKILEYAKLPKEISRNVIKGLKNAEQIEDPGIKYSIFDFLKEYLVSYVRLYNLYKGLTDPNYIF